MTKNPLKLKDTLNGLRRWWWLLLILLVLVAVFGIANATPQAYLFPFQDLMDKVLILLYGGVYEALRPLPGGVALLILMGLTWGLLALMAYLVKRGRWPTLLPLLVLLLANCFVFGAPGLIFSRSVGEARQDCELFITPSLGLRALRYPLNIRLDYAEQQFFLITYNGGENWSQFAQTFVYDPFYLGCMHFEFERDGLRGRVYMERSDEVRRKVRLIYHTEDGGQTWQIMEDADD